MKASAVVLLALHTVGRIIPAFFFRRNACCIISCCHAYIHTPCTRAARAQFQFPDCYVPDLLQDDLLLSEASFVLSHNAATGYISPKSFTKTGLSWRYSKTQSGNSYQQLSDGARALDLRPYLLQNGTVAFHHGVIHIPISLEQLLADTLTWCQENPDELVLMFFSHFDYETEKNKFRNTDDDDYVYYDDNDNFDDDDDDAVDDDDNDVVENDMSSAIALVLNKFGIPYFDCGDLYGLTVGEAMDLAPSPTGGYLLIMGVEGDSCMKDNWVESRLVTCYPNQTINCQHSNVPWENLQNYMFDSANNDATDDSSSLGPPADLYSTPFFQVQALWQVSTTSAIIGMARFSSILQDNQNSQINQKLLSVIPQFQSISLLAVDNVAVHGNALLSMLRTQCGQSDLEICGTDLAPPRLSYLHLTKKGWICVCVGIYMLWLVYSVVYLKRPKLLYTAIARIRMRLDKQEELLASG